MASSANCAKTGHLLTKKKKKEKEKKERKNHTQILHSSQKLTQNKS